jgi:mono/diheme cytochrome c family protein
MPAWGEVLTEDQIQNLVEYITTSSTGTSSARGRRLFAESCAACHGEFGEGGVHPGNPNDIIAPISTVEYLATRDDWTLRQIIARGQPEQGMSPLGQAYGGPLSTDDIDAILGFIRSWEDNPPVQLPAELTAGSETTPPPGGGGATTGDQGVVLESEALYQSFCAQCHGLDGEGGIAPAFADDAFQDAKTDDDLFTAISEGHEATAMIGWGDVLASGQIDELVIAIRTLGGRTVVVAVDGPTDTAETPTFTADVAPILSLACVSCHGALGGWDASTYTSAIESGDHGPAVVPGDPDGSPLFQRLIGQGALMPPTGALSDAEIDLVRNWIAGGAPE